MSQSGQRYFKAHSLSSQIQVLATEIPLKMMKNAFCVILKALFVLKMFKVSPLKTAWLGRLR